MIAVNYYVQSDTSNTVFDPNSDYNVEPKWSRVKNSGLWKWKIDVKWTIKAGSFVTSKWLGSYCSFLIDFSFLPVFSSLVSDINMHNRSKISIWFEKQNKNKKKDKTKIPLDLSAEVTACKLQVFCLSSDLVGIIEAWNQMVGENQKRQNTRKQSSEITHQRWLSVYTKTHTKKSRYTCVH